MFNLIFVDDESIIRDGISSCVPWNINGFNLTGLFENGTQALDYIKNNPVDVVITDINMPYMDGLTLSKILAEQYPQIMVLLLSGYDDFEYAQQALKNHVRDFLLKPITASELSQTLENIYKEITEKKEQEKTNEEMKEKLEQSFPLLRERFFNRLVNGRQTEENINLRKNYFKWNDLQQLYQVSIIKISENWNELERITLFEFLKNNLDETYEVFFNTDENVVILSQGSDIRYISEKRSDFIKLILAYKSKQDKEPPSVGCGDIVTGIGKIPNSYKGAINALDYCNVSGLSQILSIEDIRDSKKINIEDFCRHLSDVIEQLKDGKKNKTIETLNNLFDYLESSYLNSDEAIIYYTRIHHTLELFKQEMGLPGSILPMNDIKDKFLKLNKAREVFTEILFEIEESLEKRRNDIIHSRIDKAKDIISRRYTENSFSLNDICSDLYLSTSQFSFLFREGTGQTFVEYLTSYRVEEAKRLLKTSDCKVYEVAEKVGYQDPRYFSIIFKKLTGVTALEYRKRLEE